MFKLNIDQIRFAFIQYLIFIGFFQAYLKSLLQFFLIK